MGTIFLDDDISEGWLPGQSWVVKVAVGLLKRVTSQRHRVNALRRGRGGACLVRHLDYGMRSGVSGGQNPSQAERDGETLDRLIDLSKDCGLVTWAGIGGHGVLLCRDLIHFPTTEKSRAQEQKGREDGARQTEVRPGASCGGVGREGGNLSLQHAERLRGMQSLMTAHRSRQRLTVQTHLNQESGQCVWCVRESV